MSLLLFPSSGNHVTLEPNWDYDRKDAPIKTEHTARSGRYYVYKWGSYERFSFSVEFVSSANAAIINSWYMSNTKLLLMSNSDFVVHSVMIRGSDLPMGQFQKPYVEYFKGKLDLQTY